MFNPSSQYAKVYLFWDSKQAGIGFYAKEAFTIRLKSLSLGWWTMAILFGLKRAFRL
jgi:hypothetical protein